MRKLPTSMAALLVWLSAAAMAGTPTIAPQALAERIEAGDAPLILDVRTPEEFERGHVPGARLIPHDRIAEHLDELRGVSEVVAYCRSGRRTEIAAAVLEEAGIVMHRLEGSFPGWQAAQLPVAVPAEASR